MNYQNVSAIETKDGLSVVQLDFRHTRGDTMVYAIVDRRGVGEGLVVDEEVARFFLTMRVASLALEIFLRARESHTEVAGPIAGKTYEQMLAFFER